MPFLLDLVADRLVGLAFVAAPFALGFTGLDAAYYWINGAAVLLVTVVLHVTERTPATA